MKNVRVLLFENFQLFEVKFSACLNGRVFVILTLPISEHKVLDSNPAGGGIKRNSAQEFSSRRFIVQPSLSPVHCLDTYVT